jgi:hypothetical protein
MISRRYYPIIIIIIFIFLLCVASLLILISRIINPLKNSDIYPQKVEEKILLNTTVPIRYISLDYSSDKFAVLIDTADFINYTNEFVNYRCGLTSLISSSVCEQEQYCLTEMIKSLSVTNVVVKKSWLDEFKQKYQNRCLYTDNKQMSLAAYWLFRYEDSAWTDKKVTIVNKSTTKTLEYVTNKYVKNSSCDLIIFHTYFAPTGDEVFNNTSSCIY